MAMSDADKRHMLDSMKSMFDDLREWCNKIVAEEVAYQLHNEMQRFKLEQVGSDLRKMVREEVQARVEVEVRVKA